MVDDPSRARNIGADARARATEEFADEAIALGVGELWRRSRGG